MASLETEVSGLDCVGITCLQWNGAMPVSPDLKTSMKKYKTESKTLSALALGLCMALTVPIAEAASAYDVTSVAMVQGSDVIFDLATLYPNWNFEYAYGPLRIDTNPTAATYFVTEDSALFELIDTNGDLKWDALQVLMSLDPAFVGAQPTLRIQGAYTDSITGIANAITLDLNLLVTPQSSTASAVPEPATALLALLGLGGAIGFSRRRLSR